MTTDTRAVSQALRDRRGLDPLAWHTLADLAEDAGEPGLTRACHLLGEFARITLALVRPALVYQGGRVERLSWLLSWASDDPHRRPRTVAALLELMGAPLSGPTGGPPRAVHPQLWRVVGSFPLPHSGPARKPRLTPPRRRLFEWRAAVAKAGGDDDQLLLVAHNLRGAAQALAEDLEGRDDEEESQGGA